MSRGIGGWSIAMSAWRSRGLVAATVAREYQQKYRGSILGAAWSILPPLGTVLIFTLVFGGIMRARLPGVDDTLGYGIYLCAGLFAWTMFAEIVQRSVTMFVDFGSLLKKSSFPKSAVPLIVAGTALVNFAIAFAVFVLFLAAVGRFAGMVAFTAIPVIGLFAWIAIALGLLLGTLHVFIRDAGQAVTMLMQFWFWLTPIVYVLPAVPAAIADRLKYNPLTPLVGAMQDIFVRGRAPAWDQLVFPLAFAVVLSIISVMIFRAMRHDLVDEL